MVESRIGVLAWAATASVAAAISACGGNVALEPSGGTGGAGGGAGGSGGAACDAGPGGQPPAGPGACTPCAPPVRVADFPAVDAASLYQVNLLANSDAIYWVDEMNGVFRVPKTGGKFTVVPGTQGTLGVQKTTFAVDDDGLYFCRPVPDGGWSLVRTATDGSDPVTLTSWGTTCLGVAVDGGDVFVATDEGITRMDKKTGAGPTPIADGAAVTAGSIWQFGAGASGVWWIDTAADGSSTNALVAVPEGGGPLVTLEPKTFGATLALGGGSAYFSYEWPNATAATYRTSAPGAAPTKIGAAYPVLAADADAYYSVLTLGVVRVPAAGGAPILIESSQTVDSTYLLVDDTCVYWIDDHAQRVMKSWKGAP
jgi:hypothetical protein